MPRFKKKTRTIGAIRFTGKNFWEIWGEFGIKGIERVEGVIYGDYLVLTDAEGNKVPCSAGEWVVTDGTSDSPSDTFYPLSDAEFQARWEPASV